MADPGNMNAGGALAPAVEWKMNPFQGDFNPGTTNGQKMLLERLKGHLDGKQFDLSKENAAEIHQFFITKESALGGCCTIPTAFNGHNRPTDFANLLTQHSKISIELVQLNAHTRYGNTISRNANIPAAPFAMIAIDPANDNVHKPVFYDRVHSKVAKVIENLLTPIGYQDLLLHKDKFSFTNSTTGEILYNGPTMLKVIFSLIKPDTIVGMDALKAQLETMKLHEHGNDVSKMLTKMQYIHNTLKQILFDVTFTLH